MMTQPPCERCTVPTDAPGKVCSFCQTYTPPETVSQRLDVVVNRIDLLRHDLNAELQGLPDAAPLLAVTDVVVALAHLRKASVALDKATDLIEAAKGVAR